jgi:hypothetical protein
MLETVIESWERLLNQFEEAPKVILAKELLKVMPSKPDFTSDWRINDHYDAEKGIHRYHFTVIVRPIYSAQAIESVDLFEIIFPN